MSLPVLHIIIPTREGAETLKWTIKSCLHQDYENYHICVSDNCSQDDTHDVVHSFNDPKIHYLKTPERLSMSDNWEFVLNHIKEGYVMFLGDDDAMVPNTLQFIADIISNTRTELITWRVHKYNWPSHLVNELKNQLILFLDNNYVTKRAHIQLKRASKELNYNLLAGIYYGFADINLINKIKNKTGRFFNAQTPDLYSAVVLTHELKEYIYSYYGFSISGHSQKSNGCSYFFPKDLDKNKYAQMFIKENNFSYHSRIEFCNLSSAIVCADSFLWAHEKIPQIPLIDIKDLIVSALVESNFMYTKEKQMEVVAAMERIANKNNLLNYFTLQKAKFITNKSYQGISIPKMGYNEEENSLTFNCKDINIDNIYAASILIRSLLKDSPVKRKFNPLKVAKSKYFLRGFYESFFALKKKLATSLKINYI